MGILEIVSAICLILSCIFIIIMVLMQDSKKGMSQAITGGSSDNFYQKNSGRSKEARLARMTRTAAILFFVVTLVVNLFAVYSGSSDRGVNDGGTAVVDDLDHDHDDEYDADGDGHVHGDDCDHDDDHDADDDGHVHGEDCDHD